MGSISRDDVIEILKAVNESQIEEFHLDTGDVKLVVKKGGNRKSVEEAEWIYKAPLPPSAAEKHVLTKKATGLETSPVQFPTKDLLRSGPVLQPEDQSLLPIRAPMLGVFYRSPKPEAPPFVEVGQFVGNDDVVCIVEVMKLFNMVRAGVRGRIAKICAENAQLVEYNQVLFLVEKEEG